MREGKTKEKLCCKIAARRHNIPRCALPTSTEQGQGAMPLGPLPVTHLHRAPSASRRRRPQTSQPGTSAAAAGGGTAGRTPSSRGETRGGETQGGNRAGPGQPWPGRGTPAAASSRPSARRGGARAIARLPPAPPGAAAAACPRGRGAAPWRPADGWIPSALGPGRKEAEEQGHYGAWRRREMQWGDHEGRRSRGRWRSRSCLSPRCSRSPVSQAALREGGTFKNHFVHREVGDQTVLLRDVKKKTSAGGIWGAAGTLR